MGFVSRGCNNAAAENFGDNLSGFPGTVDAVVGQPVGRETLVIERAETDLVAEKRTAGHGHTAREQNIERRVQPENRSSGSTQKLSTAGLSVGAAAEGEDGSFPEFGSAAQRGAELIRFNLTKREFAETFEYLRDGEARGFFYAVIEIDETPGELAGEERANGGLAGAHESGEA